jgi:hypothetical protein
MKLKTKIYKTRVRVRHFLEGTRCIAKWTAEVCVDRRWTPLGTDAGITKHATKEEAEAAASAAVTALSS